MTLGRLILFANKQSYYVLRNMSKIILQSIADGMDCAVRDNDIPMKAVFSLLLFRTNEKLYIDDEDKDWKELFDVDSQIWSTDYTEYLWAVKKVGNNPTFQ